MVGRALSGLHPRRVLASLGAAVGLAIVASVALAHARRHAETELVPPWFIWPLFTAAGIAAAIAAGRREPVPIAATESLRGGFGRRGRRALVTGAVCVCLVTALAAAPLFARLSEAVVGDHPGPIVNDGPWVLWMMSLCALGVAVAAWTTLQPRASREATSGDARARRIEIAALTVLVSGALVARLVDLGSLPHGLWLDEARNGLVGQSLFAGDALHRVFITEQTHMGALYFYAQGAVVDVLGNTIFSVRVLPAVAGALTVPLLYLLAAPLYGRTVAFASAALLAFSTWSLTFSRLGLNSMVTVAVDLGCFVCVVRGLRSGRLGWYAAGGLLLGIGLQMYHVSRLLPVVLLAVLAQLAIRDWCGVWALKTGIAVFSAAAIVAVLPVAVFAIEKPSEFNSRVSTVSVLSEDNRLAALRESARAHALMFNYRGDVNGRHNKPRSPMLDWATGALFLCGLVMCAVRIRCWQYFLPLAWLVTSLAGGVLSILVEAPQAHRTLENSVVTALLAGIALGEVSDAAARALRWRVWRIAVALGAVTVLAVAAGLNLNRYFVRQANDPLVWADMGVAQEAAARLLARDSPAQNVWLSDIFYGSPVVGYLAHGRPSSVWPGPQVLPFESSTPRGTTVVLNGVSQSDLAALADLYPHASLGVLTAPGSAVPLVYVVEVPATDVRSGHGVVALGSSGRLAAIDQVRSDPQLAALGPAVSLVTTVAVPVWGTYRFTWDGGEWRQVFVDGRTIERGKPLLVGEGLHRLEARVATDSGIPHQLQWAFGDGGYAPIPPDAVFDPRRIRPRGLVGAYRRGDTFRGAPALVRVDPSIGLEFHVPPIGDPFTVEWRGQLYAPVAGVYRLGTQQIDTATLDVDRRRVVDNGAQNTVVEKPVHLSRGWHDVTLRFRGITGFFHVYLSWLPPEGERSVIPSAYLRPHGTGGAPGDRPPERARTVEEAFAPRLRAASEDGRLPGG